MRVWVGLGLVAVAIICVILSVIPFSFMATFGVLP